MLTCNLMLSDTHSCRVHQSVYSAVSNKCSRLRSLFVQTILGVFFDVKVVSDIKDAISVFENKLLS
jgi:hypothetical protein